MKLYELTSQRLELQHKLEALNLDEVTIHDTLEGNAQELERKIEDYGYILRNRDGLGDAMQAEIVRMQARYDAHKKHTDKVKEWLQKNMEVCGITKIECPAFSIQLKKNPASVIIDDEGLIPAEYMRTPEPKPVIAAPDKKALKEAIQKGDIVAGCHVEQKNRLVIE